MSNQIKVILTGKDQLSATLNKVTNGPMATFKKAVVGLAAPLAGVFATKKMLDFGRASVQTAVEAEKVWTNLGSALTNVGVEFADVSDQIISTANNLQNLTTVGDEEFASVLTELITTSGDYQKSLQNVSVVADLATAKQIDLRTAAQLVGRVMAGQTSALTRYGIVVKEGQDAMEVLRTQFAGFAEKEGQSFAGQLGRIADRWDDFKQAIGDALIAATDGQSILDRVNKLILDMTEYVQKNGEELTRWFKSVGDFIRDALNNIPKIIELVKSLMIAVGIAGLAGALTKLVMVITTLKTSLTALYVAMGPTGWVILGITALTAAIYALRDAYKSIELQIGLTTTEQENFNRVLGAGTIAELEALREEFRTKVVKMSQDILQNPNVDRQSEWFRNQQTRVAELNAAYTRLGDKIREIRSMPTTPTTPTEGSGQSGKFMFLPNAGLSLPDGLGLNSSEFASSNLAAMEQRFAEIRAEFERQVQELGEWMSMNLGYVIGNAVERGFTAAFSGEGIGGAIKGLTSAALEGIGRMMIDLGKPMIIMGTFLEAFRKALLGLNGFAAIAAGVGLIAAGSLLTAAARATVSRNMGGSGGGGRGGYSSPTSLSPNIRDVGQPTTIVQVNGSKVFFDLDDPIQQQNFANMFQTTTGNRKIVLQRG